MAEGLFTIDYFPVQFQCLIFLKPVYHQIHHFFILVTVNGEPMRLFFYNDREDDGIAAWVWIGNGEWSMVNDQW